MRVIDVMMMMMMRAVSCLFYEAVLVKKRKLAKKRHKYHKFIIQRVSAWKFFVYSSSSSINPLS